jgi:hypothetical protein
LLIPGIVATFVLEKDNGKPMPRVSPVYIPFALLLILATLGGCSGSFQGIRIRTQAPNIDDAFRKISLAITTDGYTLDAVDLAKHSLATGWKELTFQELSEADKKLAQQKIEGRLLLRMDVRGQLYDIYLTPSLRYGSGNTASPGTVAGVHHPLWTKWERVTKQLVEQEVHEED